MNKNSAQATVEPAIAEQMGECTALVFGDEEEGYGLLLKGRKLVLFLGVFQDLQDCRRIINSDKDSLDPAGPRELYGLAAGNAGEPVLSEKVGSTTVRAYRSPNKDFCIFLMGDQLASFLGSYQTLEECREAVAHLQGLQGLVGTKG